MQTMPDDEKVAPLVVIVGPTGSGKSDLGLAVAERYRGEIVNADSVQVYRYFNIGAAKTPEADRRGIPHHLVDICNPDQLFTAGDYSQAARQAVREIADRGALPIVVGGTGFYVRALIDGLVEGPGRNPEMRERLTERERRRPGFLHRLLRFLDSDASARIHRNDTNKLTRGLEVILSTGRPLTEFYAEARDRLTGFRVLKIGLSPPREALYERINLRTQRMFEQGLIEETRSILARGYAEALKPFESLGYAQALRLMRGELTQAQAIEETQLRTRQYAKRQWTWFRRERDIIWFDGFGDQTTLQAVVLEKVGGFLEDF